MIHKIERYVMHCSSCSKARPAAKSPELAMQYARKAGWNDTEDLCPTCRKDCAVCGLTPDPKSDCTACGLSHAFLGIPQA